MSHHSPVCQPSSRARGSVMQGMSSYETSLHRRRPSIEETFPNMRDFRPSKRTPSRSSSSSSSSEEKEDQEQHRGKATVSPTMPPPTNQKQDHRFARKSASPSSPPELEGLRSKAPSPCPEVLSTIAEERCPYFAADVRTGRPRERKPATRRGRRSFFRRPPSPFPLRKVIDDSDVEDNQMASTQRRREDETALDSDSDVDVDELHDRHGGANAGIKKSVGGFFRNVVGFYREFVDLKANMGDTLEAKSSRALREETVRMPAQWLI
ncbi:Uu.00g024270.m01.CDS01 [Anthostomella pinea]|uniref:Uu.00g024270.m01.CDS01 n=1 Tax=Anthostomella pinea TaxID=933095 RepID=A0AAI8W1F2_9PEZI|nr:Uu.00g024270.m01.CDS01 [Anthostomella pinea]